jgi:hypothetical protein
MKEEQACIRLSFVHLSISYALLIRDRQVREKDSGFFILHPSFFILHPLRGVCHGWGVLV